MTTAELIQLTPSFKDGNNIMFISPSLIGIFDNAIEMQKAGFTFAQWENTTGAGKKAKAIVKEIFIYLSLI